MAQKTSPLAGLAALLGVCLMGFAVQAAPLSTEEALQVRVLGDPNAPVTITEFSSFTCPHCATFHVQTLPILKERFIDTGQAKLVFADFPLDRLALFAGMLARCAPPARYFAFVDTLFAQQQTWARSSDPVGELITIGKLGGMSEADVRVCFDNQALAQGIVDGRLAAEQRFNVNSTPTFVFNDGADRIEGALPAEQFAAKIEALSGMAAPVPTSASGGGAVAPAHNPTGAASAEEKPVGVFAQILRMFGLQ